MIELLGMGQFSRNGHPEKDFLVQWEAVVRGQNYVDAAVRARQLLQREDCPAVCFTVMKAGNKQVKIVDLSEDSTMENPDTPDEESEEPEGNDRAG